MNKDLLLSLEECIYIHGQLFGPIRYKEQMNSLPKVVGHIKLPCDDCGCEVDDRFGDPRIEVRTYDSKWSEKPVSTRRICEWCADEQFGDHSPSSIFG